MAKKRIYKSRRSSKRVSRRTYRRKGKHNNKKTRKKKQVGNGEEVTETDEQLQEIWSFNRFACEEYNMDVLQREIKRLDHSLKQKCTHMKLCLTEFMLLDGKIKQPDGVEKRYKNQILRVSLSNKGSVISNIDFASFNHSSNTYVIDIVSKTLDEFKRRRYNTLLRAVVIILGAKLHCVISHVKLPLNTSPLSVISDPYNWISFWTLISKYNTQFSFEVSQAGPLLDVLLSECDETKLNTPEGVTLRPIERESITYIEINATSSFDPKTKTCTNTLRLTKEKVIELFYNFIGVEVMVELNESNTSIAEDIFATLTDKSSGDKGILCGTDTAE